MHELSLARSILRIIEQARAQDPFDRVNVLRITVGALAGVEIAALRFGLEAMAPSTPLAGARIRIDEIPARGWCPDCAQAVEVRSRLDACGRCGGGLCAVTGGDALRVAELTVA